MLHKIVFTKFVKAFLCLMKCQSISSILLVVIEKKCFNASKIEMDFDIET